MGKTGTLEITGFCFVFLFLPWCKERITKKALLLGVRVPRPRHFPSLCLSSKFPSAGLTSNWNAARRLVSLVCGRSRLTGNVSAMGASLNHTFKVTKDRSATQLLTRYLKGKRHLLLHKYVTDQFLFPHKMDLSTKKYEEKSSNKLRKDSNKKELQNVTTVRKREFSINTIIILELWESGQC